MTLAGATELLDRLQLSKAQTFWTKDIQRQYQLHKYIVVDMSNILSAVWAMTTRGWINCSWQKIKTIYCYSYQATTMISIFLIAMQCVIPPRYIWATDQTSLGIEFQTEAKENERSPSVALLCAGLLRRGMEYELERVLRVCNGFLCSMPVTYDGAVLLWQW